MSKVKYAKKGDIVIIRNPMEIGIGIKRNSEAIIKEITIHKATKYFEGMIIYSLELQINTKKGYKTVIRNVLNEAFEKKNIEIKNY